MRITWYGHSAFALEAGGKKDLFEAAQPQIEQSIGGYRLH